MKRALLLLVCGCGGSAPSLSHDVQPILDGHCTNIECHPGVFNRGRAHPKLVGVTAPECADGRLYVAPGDPERSYVYQKLAGREMCSGVQMPKDAAPLDETQLATIAAWIAAGARDD